ncbi:NTP transferase domain-containing protein [archaeon]|jgi:GTP:adenosylcobinamide-phosphate guanylyltransferase|nr:NTP transferase domain-containing protein [archaeon]
MVKAIIMAGGKIRRSLKDILLKREIYSVYNEDHLASKGYKPLKMVRNKRNAKRYPLIHYVISAACGSPSIDNITIVGEKNRLDKFIETQDYQTEINIVQQKGSLLENAIHAYDSINTKEHALFLASDLPRLTSFSIEDFLNRCDDKSDVYFPIVGWENTLIENRRPPMKLIDDKSVSLVGKTVDQDNRRGFRVGNMIYANPNEINNQYIVDIAYNTRKLLLPQNLITLWKHVGKKFRNKYFNKNLSVLDVENKLSEILGTNFKLIEVYSSDIEEDIDSEEDLKNYEKEI